MTPTIEAIRAHFRAHGGLWLIIPVRTSAGQARPSFAVLGVAGSMLTYEGGDLLATVQENQHLRGAEWLPVNSRGEMV